MNHTRRMLLGLVGALLVNMAGAQGASPPISPLATELSLSRIVVRDDGQEALKPAAQVQPGDTLQYTAVYRNRGKTALGDVVASLPVPQGMQIVAPTPASEVQGSTDGKTFARLPLMRRVQQPDGRWQDLPVPLSDVRYVRWPARTLAAGEQFNASLRVRVAATGS